MNVGKNIKDKLIKEKIYVPTLWKQSDIANDFETYLAENSIFLPVDQRYNDEDILFIIEITIKLLA